MKFVALREMRNHPRSVLNQLKKEKEIILTSHGKPVALVADLAEGTFEEDLARHRRARGGSSNVKAPETAAEYAVENPEILQAWIEEAEKRRQEYSRGKANLVPASKVFTEIHKKLK